MNRRDFLRALAATTAAPAVLVSRVADAQPTPARFYQMKPGDRMCVMQDDRGYWFSYTPADGMQIRIVRNGESAAFEIVNGMWIPADVHIAITGVANGGMMVPLSWSASAEGEEIGAGPIADVAPFPLW